MDVPVREWGCLEGGMHVHELSLGLEGAQRNPSLCLPGVSRNVFQLGVVGMGEYDACLTLGKPLRRGMQPFLTCQAIQRANNDR